MYPLSLKYFGRVVNGPRCAQHQLFGGAALMWVESGRRPVSTDERLADTDPSTDVAAAVQTEAPGPRKTRRRPRRVARHAAGSGPALTLVRTQQSARSYCGRRVPLRGSGRGLVSVSTSSCPKAFPNSGRRSSTANIKMFGRSAAAAAPLAAAAATSTVVASAYISLGPVGCCRRATPGLNPVPPRGRRAGAAAGARRRRLYLVLLGVLAASGAS